jgi:hypothetical protein
MTIAHLKDRVYFMITYLDDDSLVPCMETVVYLGEERQENSEIRHIFQDYESWRDRGAYPNNENGPGKVFVLPSHELSNINDFETALAELSACALRRKGRGL